MITLSNPIQVKVELHRRSFVDERRRVDWYVFEYVGSDGERYRKSFETSPGVAPVVPESGYHGSINREKVQWKDDRTCLQILAEKATEAPRYL